MHFDDVADSRALRPVLLFGTAIGLVLTAAPARAAGFYLQEQSVRGWGRANSGEVADQGPASLWWNPAAIGDAESGFSFGGTAIFPQGRVRDQGTLIHRPGAPLQPVGGLAELRDPVQGGVAPDAAAALRLGRHLAVGIVVASPFSYTSDYDPAGWQRYSAIRTRLFTVDVQPSIAWSPTPALSIGAGLNADYANALLSNALPNLAPGSPDARLKLKGKSWDFGWSAGAQLRGPRGLTFGIGYKSAITHKLDGTVEITGLLGPLAARNLDAATTARFTTPWQLAIGARMPVGAGLTLNAQAVRYGWSRFDRIHVGAPISSDTIENYRDTWSVAFGIDAKASARLTLRAGVQIDPTPTRDASRDPRVPDGDRLDFNAGASLRLSRTLMLDAAAGYTHLDASPIARAEHFYAGTPAQTDVLTDGRQLRQHALVLALGGRVGF
ncbi:MAG: aromatic hydrocarbon degradation protein [Alphaproteobacteria bacterium]|nr:aromatic hydrocarbon degradation protein [Alphaproteobacteria bacterium]